jgi:hypothetical protein
VDVFLIVVVGLVAGLAKRHLDWRLGIPGHAGVGWIATLIAGTLTIRRPGCGAAAGLAMALWGVPIGLGHSLAYNAGIYGLSGGIVDLSRAIGVRIDRAFGAAVTGASVHVVKYGYVLAAAWATGIVRRVEVYGLLRALRNHVAFGVGGGLLGWFVVRAGRTVLERRRKA